MVSWCTRWFGQLLEHNIWRVLWFDTADDFVNGLIDFAEDRCRNPKGGHRIEVINDDLYREIYYQGYTIVYEIMPKRDKVIIHEVYNQRRIFIRFYKR